MGLRDLRAGCMAFALDGATAAPALLGHEVDAGIGAVEVRPRGGPLGPEPDVGETLPVERVLEEVRLHQPLEEAPLLGLGAGDGPDVVQGSLEAAAQCSGSGVSTARAGTHSAFLGADAPSSERPDFPRWSRSHDPRGATGGRSRWRAARCSSQSGCESSVPAGAGRNRCAPRPAKCHRWLQRSPDRPGNRPAWPTPVRRRRLATASTG